MCRRSSPIRPIRFRYSTNTAKPPNGVTARSVSRSFRRSPDTRALISRWTALSHEVSSIHLLSQADAPHLKLHLRISGLVTMGRTSPSAGSRGVLPLPVQLTEFQHLHG